MIPAALRQHSSLITDTTTNKSEIFYKAHTGLSLFLVTSQFMRNISIFPVSVIYAFNFNTLDLYHQHDGKLVGESNNYIVGYASAD